MRDVRVADKWRHLSRAPGLTINRVLFEGIVGLGSNDLLFPRSRVHVLCGQNGVGKSTLLEAIHRAATGSINQSSSVRLAGGKIDIWVGMPEGKEVHGYARFDAEGNFVSGSDVLIQTVFIEPSNHTSTLRSRFLDDNVESLVEGHGYQPFNGETLKTVSELVGRKYSSCDVAEVDDIASSLGEIDDPWPYFKVVCGGAEYRSEHMGFGELALLGLYWHLQRISEPTLLLLEEPDAHIPPTSQRSVVALLVDRCLSTSSGALITGHSPVLIDSVPAEARILVGRVGDSFAMVANPSRAQLAPSVGVVGRGTVIVFVEDASAERIARVLLRDHLLAWERDVEFAVAGSESDIAAILSAVKRFAFKSVQIVGVFDGDVRDRLPAVLGKRNLLWGYTFLPGVEPPEAMLREIAEGSASELAAELGIEYRLIVTALASHQAADHHDWCAQVAKALGRSSGELIDALANLLSGSEKYRDQVADLRKAVAAAASLE